MCLARVEFIGDGEKKDRQALIDVAWIDVMPSGIRTVDLTGTVKQFAGDIRTIDFIDSVVQVATGSEPVEGAQ